MCVCGGGAVVSTFQPAASFSGNLQRPEGASRSVCFCLRLTLWGASAPFTSVFSSHSLTFYGHTLQSPHCSVFLSVGKYSPMLWKGCCLCTECCSKRDVTTKGRKDHGRTMTLCTLVVLLHSHRSMFCIRTQCF